MTNDKDDGMQNRQKLWASALLFAVFAAGAAGGGAATQAWGDRDGRCDQGPDRSVSYADRLQRELALTSAQYDTVNQILDRHQPEMHALWREVRPRIDSMRAEIRWQIAGVLTSDQQVKYQRHIARIESKRAAREKTEGRHAK